MTDHRDTLTFIVMETLRSALRDRPSAIQDEATRVLPVLRSALGGGRYYIQRNAPVLQPEDNKRLLIVRDAMTNMPTSEVEERHGVSRRTIYRLLKRHAAEVR